MPKKWKLAHGTPIVPAGKYPVADSQRISSRPTEPVVVECEACGGRWGLTEPQRHTGSCVASLLQRREFPRATMEWDEDPLGVLKRRAYAPPQPSRRLSAKWRRNTTVAVCHPGGGGPRLKRSGF